jgi:tetratricopeptide (TPR) repeat protein
MEAGSTSTKCCASALGGWRSGLLILAMGAAGLLAWFWASGGSDAAALDRLLAEGFVALEEGRLIEAERYAWSAARRSAQTGEAWGQVQMLRGSVAYRWAERTPADKAGELWRRAWDLLREAQEAGVAAEQLPALRFRLAVAEYRLGGDARTACQRIAEVVDQVPGEAGGGYRLLFELYLRLEPPDVDAALKASERLLARADLTDPDPIRLQRGLLLLQRNRIEEGRRVLGRIPPEAAQYPLARHELAWSYYSLGEWKPACAEWERLRQLGADLGPRQPEADYALGCCYLALGQPERAEEAWQRVPRQVPLSEEARAAAFQLGLLRSARRRYGDAVEQFRLALADLAPSWQGRYGSAAAWRVQLEEVWTAWMDAGAFGPAAELALACRSIALPGEAWRRAALASLRAASDRLQAAQRDASPRREQEIETGRELLRQAAGFFELAVRELDGEGDSGELLWHAAQCYLQAGEAAAAAAVLELGLTGIFQNQRQREAEVALAETYQVLGRPVPAARLLRRAAAVPGPHQVRALYLLALVLLDLGEYEEAEQVLRQALLLPAEEPESELPALARFALVHVLFRREAYAEAADQLEKLLAEPILEPQQTATRYWLAEAYRRCARQEASRAADSDSFAARQFYLRLKQRNVEMALSHFEQVLDQLRAAGRVAPLSQLEALRWRESQLGKADCLLLLGRYEEALQLCRELLDLEPPGLSNLTAAVYAIQALTALQRHQEAQEVARTALAILQRLPDTELPTDRRGWQEWFGRASGVAPEEPQP